MNKAELMQHMARDGYRLHQQGSAPESPRIDEQAKPEQLALRATVLPDGQGGGFDGLCDKDKTNPVPLGGKQPYGNVKVELTPDATKAVITMLMEFFNKYHNYSGETLCQDDNGNIYSSEVMGDIADLVFKDVEIDY